MDVYKYYPRIVFLFGFLLLMGCSGGCLTSVYSQSSNSSQTNSSEVENNKNVIIKLTNAFNERNLTAIDVLVAKDIRA